MNLWRSALLLGGTWALGGLAARGQSAPDYEQTPVNYSETTPNDALAKLHRVVDLMQRGESIRSVVIY